jgi:hypothetical protein
VKSSHTRCRGASGGWEDVADCDVLDEFRVEVGLCVGGAEDVGKD